MTRSTQFRTLTDDHLDRQFTAFFRSQTPSPWPSSPVPGNVEPVRPPRRDSSLTGRLTLAASVAALLGLGLWIAPQTQPRPNSPTAAPNEPSLLPNATANGKDLLDTTSTKNR